MMTTTLRRLRRLILTLAMLPILSSAQTYTNENVDQLTAQIALYPDSLLSQVLMASTYPADVTEAAKWSRANSDAKGDEAVQQVENESWDPAVQSLVAFPQVIIMMGEKPQWVQELGDAFLASPEAVMDSVQRLRAKAQAAGNLKSNAEMTVKVETPPPAPSTTTVVQQPAQQQVIVIEPAQPQVVYVPQYNPTVVYGAWPYPAYPPYYIPPPPGYWFSSAVATGIAWGVGIGVTNALWGGCNWGWGRGDVNINVNRYNNINVNRRLDFNNSNMRWNHNVDNRKGVGYKGGNATRDNLQRKYQAGGREQYRGRDDNRARAQQAMQNKGIQVDQAAMRDRAQNVDRGAMQQRAQDVDRSQLQRKAQNVDGGAVQQRAQGADRSAMQQRAQNVDRGAMQQRSQDMNRENALRGAGDRNVRAQADRGAASRQAAAQNRPQMQNAGGGGNRAQMQRPAGGGGARGGGGGGRNR